jgi:hypothetical protein
VIDALSVYVSLIALLFAAPCPVEPRVVWLCVGFAGAQAIRHSDPITNTDKDNCEQSLTLTLDVFTLTRFRFD